MSTYSTAKEIITDVIALANKINNNEILKNIYELQRTFYDLNDENYSLKESNRELTEKINSLEDLKEKEKRIKRSNGLIAEYTDENGRKIMICTCCWDKEKKIIQSQFIENNRYYCKVCKNESYYGQKEIYSHKDHPYGGYY